MKPIEMNVIDEDESTPIELTEEQNEEFLKDLEAQYGDEVVEGGEEEEQEESTTHCTSVCQHAHKIKCVCGCGGKNHGIKSMVKMEAFFSAPQEQKGPYVFPEDRAEVEAQHNNLPWYEQCRLMGWTLD